MDTHAHKRRHEKLHRQVLAYNKLTTKIDAQKDTELFAHSPLSTERVFKTSLLANAPQIPAMPALPPIAGSSRPKVLVTGANGFIGQWVLKTVLDRGYDALVVVRSEAKARGLKDFLLHDYQGQLDFAYIPDFTKVSYPRSTQL